MQLLIKVDHIQCHSNCLNSILIIWIGLYHPVNDLKVSGILYEMDGMWPISEPTPSTHLFFSFLLNIFHYLYLILLRCFNCRYSWSIIWFVKISNHLRLIYYKIVESNWFKEFLWSIMPKLWFYASILWHLSSYKRPLKDE